MVHQHVHSVRLRGLVAEPEDVLGVLARLVLAAAHERNVTLPDDLRERGAITSPPRAVDRIMESLFANVDQTPPPEDCVLTISPWATHTSSQKSMPPPFLNQ